MRPLRLFKPLLAVLLATGGVLLISGEWHDPLLWAYGGSLALTFAYAASSMDEDLARERFHPPNPGADGLSLKYVRIIALAHIVVSALDLGRWQLTRVPDNWRVAALIGMAVSFGLVFRSMRENRFFSAVVRIQTERGHRVIDSGPYSVVRHPGYVGMIVGVPLSALAIGSWIGLTVAVAYSALILRRVAFEDGYLQKNLNGYTAYTQRVRYRLVPGVW